MRLNAASIAALSFLSHEVSSSARAAACSRSCCNLSPDTREFGLRLVDVEADIAQQV